MSAYANMQAVSQAHEAIRAATEARRLEEQLAAKRFSQATAEAHRTLNSFLQQYEELAYELACQERAAPYSCSGGQLRHDEAEVCEDGIQLRWFEDNGPDTWFLATWDSLEQLTKGDGDVE